MGIMNQFKTFLLLAVLTGIMLFIGRLFGMGGFYLALAIVLVMNFVTYFWSDKIVLFMYRAKEVKEKDQPNLYKMIREVTRLAGIPMPKVYIIPSSSPNAFATGRSPNHSAVAVTQGIMELLSERELKGVLAHEIAHVKNRDILIQTVAATIAGVISYLANMALWFGIGGDNDDNGGTIGVIVIAILAPLIALIIQLAISRSREYLADEKGATTIHDSKALADALEKLDKSISKNPMRFGNNSTSSLFIANPFNAKGITTWFSTHPPMDERIKRLRAMKF
jgi:heat shock protein HtpX